MHINFEIQQKIENFLNESLASAHSVSGGCIADSKLITTKIGKRFFLKTQSGGEGMFLKEAHGLQELAKAQCIGVPEVVLADYDFLLLEFIEQGPKPDNFFSDFGAAFAQMHRFTAAHYGFYEDNFIGSTPQYNVAEGAERTNWSQFYLHKRLYPQVKFARQSGLLNRKHETKLEQLFAKVPEILHGSEEVPTLLHGDLWGGNYLCDKQGKAVLIDPAAYYGHREADLAMTKMFGGFSHEFYKSYQQHFPLAPGWEYRENLYLLYHQLNHLNLFGSSYLAGSIRLIDYYL
ncbi:MAG: fructosamine kinase family protein [Salinivirgaceae bacterium]